MTRHTATGMVLPSMMALLLMISLAAWTQARQLWLQEQVLKLQDQRLLNRSMAQASAHIALQDIWAQTRNKQGLFFPATLAEHELVRTRLAGQACGEGICIAHPSSTPGEALPTSNLSDGLTRLDQAQRVPASLLPSERVQAWYWVEVWRHAEASAEPVNEAELPRFYYRITAWVVGGLPGARAALQAVWQRDASPDASTATANVGVPAGRWLSWQWLTP